MKVPDDFKTRQAALADELPRPVLASLLKKLLPRVPVAVRRPEGGWQSEPTPTDNADRFAGGAMAKLKRRSGGTRRSSRGSSRRYEVVNPHGASNHRRSWRKAMVECILACDNERDAARMMEENYRATRPKWADSGIDLSWVANEAGYVRLL